MSTIALAAAAPTLAPAARSSASRDDGGAFAARLQAALAEPDAADAATADPGEAVGVAEPTTARATTGGDGTESTDADGASASLGTAPEATAAALAAAAAVTVVAAETSTAPAGSAVTASALPGAAVAATATAGTPLAQTPTAGTPAVSAAGGTAALAPDTVMPGASGTPGITSAAAGVAAQAPPTGGPTATPPTAVTPGAAPASIPGSLTSTSAVRSQPAGDGGLGQDAGGQTPAPPAASVSQSAATPDAAPAAPAQAPALAPAAPANAPAAPANAAPAPLATQLTAPVQRLVAAGDGTHTLTVNVTPENLGPVTIRASIDGDTVRVELVAPTDQARDALRGILTDLRRDLAAVAGASATLDLPTGSTDGGQARRDDAAGRERPAWAPPTRGDDAGAARSIPTLLSHGGGLDVLA